MFKKGDSGVPCDMVQFELYAKRTRVLVEAAGSSRGMQVA